MNLSELNEATPPDELNGVGDEPHEPHEEPQETYSGPSLGLILESLLFSAQKPLSPAELREVLNKSADEESAPEFVRVWKKTSVQVLERHLTILAEEHEAAERSFRLVCVAGSWQFVTKTDFAPWLRSLLGVKSRPSRLSQPALETLAIIAYRQPITRAEIEQIRGVAVDAVVNTLKERGLIVEAGRAEVIGRPMQYATSTAFLEYFGLASLDDMPSADELRRIPVERPDALVTAFKEDSGDSGENAEESAQTASPGQETQEQEGPLAEEAKAEAVDNEEGVDQGPNSDSDIDLGEPQEADSEEPGLEQPSK